MAAVAAAANEEISELQAAVERPPTPAAIATAADARPLATLDPQLLMAARRGDSQALKDLLLQLNDDGKGTRPDEGSASATHTTVAAAGVVAAAHSHVIVQVDPRRHDAAAAPGGGTGTAAAQPAEEGVTMDGDSLLHVVAACGDTQKYLACVHVIVHNKEKKRRALEARNNRGDTPLHCAAGAGNAHMISCLIHLIANNGDDDEVAAALKKKALVRMRNECGETALHQAVRAPHNNEACIDKLMEHDPELACVQHNDGTSPLYLAISLGNFKIAQHLYSESKGKLSYSGPDGRNVLHAVVSCGQEVLSTVLEWLKEVESRTTADNMRRRQEGGGQGVAHHHLLLSELTRQRDKENGSTPLHLAAGFSPPSLTRLLLDANVSTAYQPDKRGMYPIHVAAGAGGLGTVEILLERCPECATLRDANGRTFLHVAVEEEGWYNVVKYVCRQRRPHAVVSSLLSSILNNVVKYVPQQRRPHATVSSLLSSILNAQDINGDTALHRAVYAGNRTIFFCLVRNQRVRLDIKNKEGMTPIEVAWSKMPLDHYYAWDSRIHIRKYLQRVGALYGCETRGDIYHQKHVLPKQDEDEMAANLTAAIQVLCIFSVLMTTVTFASAFTLPGGYRSAGDGSGSGVAGTPVLGGRSYAFDVFVLSDALAFICSLYATSLLLYAGVPGVGTLSGRFRLLNDAYMLMWQAARSLVAAFALGLYLVLLPDDRTVAIAVVVLTIIIAIGFLKGSEGIIISRIMIRRNRVLSIWDLLLWCIVSALDYFWSYIIIFGLPAIRKWARLP